MENYLNSKPGRALFSVALLMAIFALGSYAMLNFEKQQYVSNMPATISVTGKGEVTAKPDVGKFSFSVTAEGETAAVAQEASGTKINAIMAYLREQGIEEKDIKTEYYNMFPRWKYEEKPCAYGMYCPPGEQIEDGFEVSQTVSVKIRATDKAPTIITGVGELGATNISGLEFTVDDTDALKAEAQAKAIADAKEKADILAKDLGVKIVKLISYYENMPYYGAQPYYAKEMDMAVAESSFGGAELPMGENETVVEVNVTYEVR
jgi:uncharacterized protein